MSVQAQCKLAACWTLAGGYNAAVCGRLCCQDFYIRFVIVLLAHALQVLHNAKLIPQDIETVLLVGRATRMPRLQSLLAAYFGRDASVLSYQVVRKHHMKYIQNWTCMNCESHACKQR